MKAHQSVIRDQLATASNNTLFTDIQIPKDINLQTALIKQINYKTASTIILPYEWIGTMPLPKSCRYMFGIYFNNILGGAIVYVEPSTRQFNKLYPRQVLQLNRGACAHWTPKNTASKLIAHSLKELRKLGIKVIIAYCTPEAGEIGTIYQALGWWYVGETTPSKTYFLDSHWISERTLADKIAWAKTKEQRWQDKFSNLSTKTLSPKYKYVKILAENREASEIAQIYKFSPLPYPKRNNGVE